MSLMNDIIKMENVNFSYNNRETVLRNIDINVKKGAVFGLLGPSGAGKTTIIRLLTGQLRYDEENIKVFGNKPFGDDFYRKIGIVIDSIGLYGRLSCYENLRVVAKIHSVEQGRIDDVLKMVGLEEVAKREVYKLSSGMQQRLAIARAILHEPELLFLDEPTRGLDPGTAHDIQDLLIFLKKEGTTIFLTTHNMQEAEKMCDLIGFLFDGEMVESGTIASIKKKYDIRAYIQVIGNDGVKREYHQNRDKEAFLECIRNEAYCSIHTQEPSLESIFINLKEGKADVQDQKNREEDKCGLL